MKPKKQPPRVQSLGNHTYALPDVVVTTDDWRHKFPTIVWIGVITVVSPLLLMVGVGYNILMLLGPRFIKDQILATVIPRIMRQVQRKTWNQRKLLLQHVHGRVLDVGSGGGAYMAHLSPQKVSHVVALEPVQACHAIIRKEAERVGLASYQVTIRSDSLEEYCRYYLTNNSGCAGNHAHHHASNEQFDWIILGNVLCEVPDVNKALEYVHQLLKPGGHVYFQEHLGCPAGTMQRKLQNVMNPWWKRISGGCNCNRDSLFAIEGMEQWDVISWECSNFKVMMGPVVMGLAKKAIV